jgi:N-acetylglucosamine-6-phosphate deacetylase
MAPIALTGATVCTGDAVLAGHAVLVEGRQVAGVVPERDVPAGAERLACDGAYLAPGLVDLQVNGGGGVLLDDDPTPGAVARIVAAHRRLGSTSVLPTLTSTPDAVLAAAVEAAATPVTGSLGLHVEGPFLDPAHAGIHDRALIRPMTGADAERLARLGPRGLVTLAPERVDPRSIARLARAGVHLAAGHSGAGPDALGAAVEAGLRLVTHLFNAMSGLRAREPGLAGAALADDRVACGLIADGHHVSDPAIRVALRCKPAGRLFLVSDAMPPVGSSDARFRLGGRDISVRAGRCVAADGTLAGAAVPLAHGVRHLVGLGVPVPEALRMASTVPADLVGAGGAAGRIAAGRLADLVVVDERGSVERVIAAGEVR